MSPPDYSYEPPTTQVKKFDDYHPWDTLGIASSLLLSLCCFVVLCGPPVMRVWTTGDWRCLVLECSVRVSP